ncbi:MAG: hypothetical protein RDV48_26290 [Candidatus Eremiobacteraeota bacterium]|nr:hypothetical protein [Candidatus Eremiobacteraeota bacterium]
MPLFKLVILAAMVLFLSGGCRSQGGPPSPAPSPALRPSPASSAPLAAAPAPPVSGPVQASDYESEVRKLLDLPLPGSQNSAEGIEYLTRTLANMKLVATACEMYASENGGLYPDREQKLVPRYLGDEPCCFTPGGRRAFTYKAIGKNRQYALFCKGQEFSHLGVPEDYPQLSSSGGLMIKPGVRERRPGPTRLEEALELFRQGTSVLPGVLRSGDRAKARCAREKLKKALVMEVLDHETVRVAKHMIARYEKIESRKAPRQNLSGE